ncbi:hypothetical protein, partial [Burkholderia sp. Tr-849]|uniref:hypothetical protein n=1 Tax=Burkholderia sp. Tr-849 TaxID=2608330 RepID=UPI001F04124E
MRGIVSRLEAWSAAVLLRDVHEFMREQCIASVLPVAAAAEEHVLAERERLRAERGRGAAGGRVVVHAHVSQIAAEPRLHGRPRSGSEGLAGARPLDG